jgi:hypothetical protein
MGRKDMAIPAFTEVWGRRQPEIFRGAAIELQVGLTAVAIFGFSGDQASIQMA